MDRLGAGYDVLKEINPRLVYASATGFGQHGPYSQLGAMDLTVQAMTGVMSANGFPESPPVKAGVAVADFAGGTHLALAVVAALYQRILTDAGQRVDVSMQDALLPYLTSNISGYLTNGESHPARTGNRHGSLSVSPYNVYPASDGFVAILCAADRHWLRLCDVMDRPDLRDDESLAMMTSRAARSSEIDEIVGAWTVSRSRESILSELMEAGIPVAPVLTVPEVLEDKHLIERKMIQILDHPTLGKIPAFGSPILFSGSEPVRPTPSPLLGEHTGQVLQKFLGYDDARIEELRSDGVI
jgi:formyl-CoA transferase